MIGLMHWMLCCSVISLYGDNLIRKWMVKVANRLQVCMNKYEGGIVFLFGAVVSKHGLRLWSSAFAVNMFICCCNGALLLA